MSVFASLIIVLLAMLIQSFLELCPGVFAIFYHHSLGKTSVKKADDRALSFILGIEICSALVFLITYIIVNSFITAIGRLSPIFLWIMSGLFLAESIIAFFYYYRPQKSTKKTKSTALFLPRRFSSSLTYHAEHAKDRSSTITLGLISYALELFFTIPLYIIVSTCIFYNFQNLSSIFIIVYVIIATIPLFAMRALFRTDHNLAEIQRLRIKKKLPTRLILSVSYLIISIVTFLIGLSI